ncbi:MAG: ABC transporter permease [Oscillospiraceae bacterium]
MVNEQTRKFDWQKLMAPVALVILFLFFWRFGRNFFPGSFISLLESTYSVALMAFGITFVITTGGIDLSIGTNMMFSALLGAYFVNTGLNIWLALAYVVINATAIGFINGLLISKVGLPPFIATLGMMMMTQGAGSIITKVTTQYWPSSFDENGFYKQVFYKTSGGIPTGLIYMGVFFILAVFLLNKTKFGRYTVAIGSNEEAVRLSGVNASNWKLLVYTICGFFAGLAGVAYAATYTSIIPGTGNGLEMNAIAAVVIGGTSMSGGVGTMVGTLIGALLMSVLKTGLMSLNLQGHYQTFFTGLVVILAVLLDIYRTKRAEKV